jgi:hypothetical protein
MLAAPGPRVDRQMPGLPVRSPPGRGQHGGGDFLFHQQKTHLALPRRFHQFHRLATRVSDDEGGAGFLERCCKHFDGGGHCEVSRKFFSVSATMTEPVSASNGAEGVRR